LAHVIHARIRSLNQPELRNGIKVSSPTTRVIDSVRTYDWHAFIEYMYVSFTPIIGYHRTSHMR